jgi:hypothetical protein
VPAAHLREPRAIHEVEAGSAYPAIEGQKIGADGVMSVRQPKNCKPLLLGPVTAGYLGYLAALVLLTIV